MAIVDLVLRSRRVAMPRGVAPAAVAVADGRIVAVTPWDDAPAGSVREELGELALLPGVVDTHVHVNEPGRASWEGFPSGTRAAAAGGVTTLVDMPLNSIPATTTSPALAAKRGAAAGRSWVDVGFWGGVVPGNLGELALLHRGRRARLQGVPGAVRRRRVRPRSATSELRVAAAELARLGSVLLVHAELARTDRRGAAAGRRADGATPPGRRLARRRPRPRRSSCWRELARATGARIHVVHLSSGAGLAGRARGRGTRASPLSAETCPHYLTFAAEEIPDGATEFKCAPPIRGAGERERLWEGLADGSIDLVATDHSPCPPELKRRESGDFFAAWGGIASLQLALAGDLDRRPRARGFGLERLAAWMAAAPARLAGLAARKGAIAPGCDADLVVFDPEASFPVEPDRLYHRHPMTPYAGRTLRGVVRSTWLRGQARLPTRERSSASRVGSSSETAMSDFTDLVDLASERLGGAVLAANDEFFAAKENLLREQRAGLARGRVHRPRQVDGRLGDAAAARAGARLVPRSGSACRASCAASWSTPLLPRQLPRGAARSRRAALDADPSAAAGAARRAACREILPRTPLAGRLAERASRSTDGVPRSPTCVLHIYPDGGVARLRVHGEVVPEPARLDGAARSTSRRSRTAAACSTAATCSSASATT